MLYNMVLDSFITVADEGSFTKAADKLFISHTAVIKQINSLEADLGVRLFKRTNHGVVLTAGGKALYENALKLIELSERAVEDIREAAAISTTTVRVGTSVFYPCHVFMDLWDSVSRLCSHYQLMIVPIEDDAKRLSGLNKSYDFIIGSFNSHPGGSSYRFIPLGNYKFTLALPRQHSLAGRTSLSFKDLSGQKLMVMHPGTSTINDSIRAEIERNYPDILIEDIEPHYSLKTFNRCLEENAILISLECWNKVHPGLVSIPLEESYEMPYGIITAKELTAEMDGFISAVEAAVPQP